MTEHRIDLAEVVKGRNGHSSFGPSSSAMWANCAGSLIPNLLAPDNAGIDAAYGTVAHSVTETWLCDGKKPRHLIGTTEWVEAGDWGHLIEIDEVMLDHARSCVDWVRYLPGDHFFERRVDFSRVTPIPKQTGTADFIACSPGHMVVADWKFGKGYVVYAKYEDFDELSFEPWLINSQLTMYALGAFYEFDKQYHFETIEIRVAQPRLEHYDIVIITRAQLLVFEKWIKERAHLAWDINAPRTPSPQACIWCKVKATCAASAKLMADLLDGAFADLDAEISADDIRAFKDELDVTLIPKMVDVMTLSTDRLAQIYHWRGFVDRWWKAVEFTLYVRACKGEVVPGYKLVESRSRRVFRKPDEAGEKLIEYGVPENLAFVQTVPTPAEAERLLRKVGYRTKELPALLDGLVFKPAGKPTLVPVIDKRPALVDVTSDVFADLTEEDLNHETKEM